MRRLSHKLPGLTGGLSFKRPCLVSAVTLGLLIGVNVLDVRSEVQPTAVPGYDGVVRRQATAGNGFPFDLRKTIDWSHCPHHGTRSDAEGYLSKYGELRMRHLAQIKEIGAVEPTVVLEAYSNTGRHVVYMLAGKTLYRVSWWFMFKDRQKEKNEVKVYPVNDVFVSLVEDGVWSLQRDFKGWEDCGTVFSTAGGFVLFSYKSGGVYRTTVCDTMISIKDIWGLERYRNLFTLLTGKFNVDP